LKPPSNVLVEVGYSCTACKLHYLHRADVAAVATVLNRAPHSSDVLVLGGCYIHCGQPMQALGSEIRRLNAPAYTDPTHADALDVYLTTRILRCNCGFQMELPE
jgi:hypothetical protein